MKAIIDLYENLINSFVFLGANNFGGNSPNEAQNQGGPNSWASSSASAFASAGSMFSIRIFF